MVEINIVLFVHLFEKLLSPIYLILILTYTMIIFEKNSVVYTTII